MTQDPLQNLIRLLSKLPGLGPRSGRRIALHLLERKEEALSPLSAAFQDVAVKVKSCETCGNLDAISPCQICASPSRDVTQICVVEAVSDLWALERTGVFFGKYHVLGGTLSAMDGRGPEDLRLKGLFARVHSGVQEVIMALNATVEGQATAHYITERLSDFPEVHITTLARGVPIGGELDYLDDGTLMTALQSRRTV
ncbi:Recombination protein RecR [Candidatus Bealeia paramacronuclearis]|uniref:Recombination protein RecR n=1 Tax=Candidatus Bealeia paramacronuclearis TaxID=1921001 RepID=A0ABZ2C130_9PROT|nr:Recombination protein RecR [Candidatus Bealeia paramacronuclearis]